MIDAPLITIGITCFNAADTIDRAIGSAVAQTYPNIQIIVIDDCSTDNSHNLINAYKSRINNLEIIRHEKNRGYPGALNSILHAAKGQYIAFFDDDDFSENDRLQRQYDYLLQSEKRLKTKNIFCYSNRTIVKGNPPAPSHVSMAIGRHAPEPYGESVADYLLWRTSAKQFTWGMFGSCTMFVRKESFSALGDFDENFRRCAEWDMAVRAAFQGYYFIAVDAPLVTQYKTATSDKAGKTPLKYRLMLVNKYKDYLKKNHSYAGAIMLAHAKFYGNKKKKIKNLFYRWIAYSIAAPSLIERKMAWKK
ncbi:MAG: glycosyl transferase [Micavibrio aeruginosavorus]|uniref:Glycosyl transferase n=1 Tax=Micavibrio aeruginosavorus TaxID=349221 RepID=A0A2W5MYI6_9BACT|nr:MAG: glycosyl transferase [Micavibrio aeruginosavorus]